MEMFFGALFVLGIVAMFGGVVALWVWVFSQRSRIKNAPVITVRATVIAKRIATSGALVGGANTEIGAFGLVGEDYYMTFQFDNGNRREFHIKQSIYAP